MRLLPTGDVRRYPLQAGPGNYCKSKPTSRRDAKRDAKKGACPQGTDPYSCVMLAHRTATHFRRPAMSISLRFVLGGALAALSLTMPPALAQTPTLAELANYAGADRTQRLIAGAKR